MFRDGSASGYGLPMAVSVTTNEPIHWPSGQAICAISFTDFNTNYTYNNSYSSSTRQYVCLCVPVGMLSLEKDWPQLYLFEIGTLYGSPDIPGVSHYHYACEWAVQLSISDTISTSIIPRVRVGDTWRCERILSTGMSSDCPKHSIVDDHAWFLVLGFAYSSTGYNVSFFCIHSLEAHPRSFISGVLDVFILRCVQK